MNEPVKPNRLEPGYLQEAARLDSELRKIDRAEDKALDKLTTRTNAALARANQRHATAMGEIELAAAIERTELLAEAVPEVIEWLKTNGSIRTEKFKERDAAE